MSRDTDDTGDCEPIVFSECPTGTHVRVHSGECIATSDRNAVDAQCRAVCNSSNLDLDL